MKIWLKHHNNWLEHDIQDATSLEDAAYKYIRKAFSCLTDDNHTVRYKPSYIAIVKNKKSPLFEPIGNIHPQFDGDGVVWFDFEYSDKNPNHYYINLLNTYIRKRKINKFLEKETDTYTIFSDLEKNFCKENFLIVTMEEFPDTIFYFKNDYLKMIEDVKKNILMYHQLSMGDIVFRISEGYGTKLLNIWVNYKFNKQFEYVTYLSNYHLKKYKCLKSTYKKRLKENTLNIIA